MTSSYSMANRTPWRPLVLTLTVCAGLGCGDDGPKSPATDRQADNGSAATENVGSKAADLRVSLNLLLGEHLVFAAKATGAALGSRADEYEAYAALLNTNGEDVG